MSNISAVSAVTPRRLQGTDLFPAFAKIEARLACVEVLRKHLARLEER